MKGEEVFRSIGCDTCHIPVLPLMKKGWFFTEPSPCNPPTNLRVGDTETYRMDLQSSLLPAPRLAPTKPDSEVIEGPVFTDFKLHDITMARMIQMQSRSI